jgi:phosphoribosylformylglycinamidine cyclo-ligase
MPAQRPVDYRAAGVDIGEGDRAVEEIKRHARRTFTRGVLAGIGGFGAAYRLTGYRHPVLVSSADGVGTKLKVAFMTGRHDTVGQCLVNHCVNDIAVEGATPLFFLDYFATGRLDAGVAAIVVGGIARACRENRCALIGGETAEMPGFYAPGEYDLAGFIVGAVERGRLITGSGIRAGDALIALPSTGLHTNGYSLARRLLFDVAGFKPGRYVAELGCTVADELLKVHRSYARPIHALTGAGLLIGAAHITGGGVTGNLPRILPSGLAARIAVGSWPVPPIFDLLRRLGHVSDDEWRRTFNLGAGMILAIAERRRARAERLLDTLGEPHYTIGRVVRRRAKGPRVVYE